MNSARINPQQLSSRKLWQLAAARADAELSAEELSDVIAELAKRCHDLDQLQQLKKLQDSHRG